MKIEIPKDLDKFFKNLGFAKIQSTANDVFIICPFHKETEPSLSIRRKDGIWQCFGCGESGNFIRLLDFLGIDYEEFISTIDALGREEWQEVLDVIMKNRINMRVKSHRLKYKSLMINGGIKNNKTKDIIFRYMKTRGFKEKTIKEFKVCYTPYKESKMYLRALIPVHDTDGKFLWFEGRRIDKEKRKKYIRPYYSMSGNYLFNYHRALKRDRDYVILVEGIFDAMMLHQWGFNSVANFGLRVSNTKLNLLTAFDEVYICFDGDVIGRKSQYEVLVKSVNRGYGVNNLLLPENKDICDITRKRFMNILDYHNYNLL